MANTRKVSRQNLGGSISESVNIPVVSSVKCIRLVRRPRYGFGFTLKYCFSYDMKIDMDEDDRHSASGSDADISSESDDTSPNPRSNKKPETIDNVVVQWVMPNSAADQAGLIKGDKIVNINNTAVYGKKKSGIQKLLKNSTSIDVDIVEGTVNQRGKGKRFRRTRWNNYDGYSSNHEEASDNGSSLSLTSCSSDNATSPSSLSPPVTAGDRCFVVTYGQLYEPEIVEKGHVQMHAFPPPTSYSDEEPQMENKSVGLAKTEIEANFIDVEKTNDTTQKEIDNNNECRDEQANKALILKSSTTSSVLVESLDTTPTCVTVTKATYSTLASPQLTRGESGYSSKEDGSDTSDNKLTLTQGDNSIWELRIDPPSHVRSRSPSPAQRRVSYLMATEGSSSLASGNWVVKSVMNGETVTNLVPLKEESTENIPSECFQDQDDSDADDDTIFPDHSDEYVLAEMTSSEPVLNISKKTEDVGDTDEQPKVNDRRHSLKRKISAEDLFEVEKEGFLWRKLAGSHGRRSWKQAYVALKAHVLYIYKDKPDQLINAGQDEKPISIKSCIVDIAYDYRKRQNVFRLTTYNGSQYLFQAKDKDSMMSWIAAIQKNNNPDEDKSGVASENLIVRRKKNMDNENSSGQQTNKSPPPASLKISGLKKSLSFKSNSGGQSSFKGQKKAINGDTSKATWHNKMVNKMKKIGSTSSPIPSYQTPGYSVGLPLDRSPVSKTNLLLPLLVEHCCYVVENKGLESVGIYRVPGNSANVAALEEELNAKCPDAVDFEDPRWNEPNNMGSLLKKFLRKLPEGLVTSELYGSFIEANRKDGEERMWSLKHLIQQLPPAYGETLGFIIRHLKNVSEHSDTNKMEIRNLAIVFGPTIVRTGEDNMMTMVNDMPDRFRIVESFITNFDWFFDNDTISNGSLSPTTPPIEEVSPHIMSSNMMNSMEQAAVSYESSESNWKIKGTSIKLPNFKNFMKHSTDSSKKTDISPTHGGEHLDNGKLSPHIGRASGGSQPNSPTTGRRKIIKRHHSTSNISTSPVHDDFDRSKSEGEDDEGIFARPSVATKAYSYPHPPPPSYRELRDKGSFRGHAQAPNTCPSQPSSKESLAFVEGGDTPDFNSLSEETKKRLLRFTLQKKVNEKKKQQIADAQFHEPVAGNKVDFNKGVVNMSFVQGDISESTQSAVESNNEDQAVVFEPQLKPNDLKKRFENLSEDNNNNHKLAVADQSKPVVFDSIPQVRRREGAAPSSSSRNFKIYSEVNFGPNEINQWVNDMGKDRDSVNKNEHGTERGRSRAKIDDSGKGKRSASVSRSSFIQDENDILTKRRSTSLQDINVDDSEYVSRQRTLSNSSDSSDTSDEEGDVYDASKSFDEKLHHLLQKTKLENNTNNTKTETPPVRRFSQTNRPPSYTRSRSSVEKMRAMDPTSKIQTGAVSTMKSLFESGAAHQHLAKSRSSSISSTSSGSVLSSDAQRRKTAAPANNKNDPDVKKRIWEVEPPAGDKRKQWKEPVWLAKEREMKSLKSGSESSLQSDDNNNNVSKTGDKRDYVSKQYSRSASLPLKQSGLAAKRVVVEGKPETKTETIVNKTNVQYKSNGEKAFGYFSSGASSVQTDLVKTAPTNSAQNANNEEPSEQNGLSRVEMINTSKSSSVNTAPTVVSGHVVHANDVMPVTSAKTQVKNELPPVKAVAASHVKTVNTHEVSPIKTINRISKSEGEPCAVQTNNKDELSPVIMVTTAPVKAVTTVTNITSPKSTVHRKNPSAPKKTLENTKSLPGDDAKQKGATRTRRRIVSDTHHRGYPDSRHPGGRTFTAPILGTVVTTTTAFELDRFAIKPQPVSRSARNQKSLRKGEKANTVQVSPNRTLTVPGNPVRSAIGSPEIRRKGNLPVPSLDDAKRLSTDRSILEQNALHIKELLDEMNTEHSLKMERQKSDTISINAQRSARKKAMRRRHSFGQERDNRVVVASCMTPSDEINEQTGNDSNTSLPTPNNDLQRNINTVKWVGVSS